MLSLTDCLDFCGLDDSEIDAIAEHEHLPPIVAAELGNTLLQSEEGVCRLYDMVLDTMKQALERGSTLKVDRLSRVYQRLHATHPLPQYPQFPA
ncbi:MAG: hypothetical protein LBF93_10390 [Zoogloeaceae bacterium]|jgi:hypothetical protein|nr:hypothetical protein [Zoogloeaceae bacterium]